MKLENEKAFIKAITDIMFNNNLRFKVGFREGIINYIHPTSTHYMVTELVYKSAIITVYTDKCYYDVQPLVTPLIAEFDLQLDVEIQTL